MCLIVDANIAHELSAPASVDATPVLQWLSKKKGQLAIGGKLTVELNKTRFAPFLLQLYRAGVVVNYPHQKLKAEEQVISQLGICVSNDIHILALARLSGARVVFSKDSNLGIDFSNPKIVSPRGRIYKKAQHAHLLSTCKHCTKP